jgi:hypothetical protein
VEFSFYVEAIFPAEAITISGPRHNRKTYVPRSPYRSGLNHIRPKTSAKAIPIADG